MSGVIIESGNNCVAAYSRGLQDARDNKAANLTGEAFKACYAEGYSHGKQWRGKCPSCAKKDIPGFHFPLSGEPSVCPVCNAGHKEP